MRVEAHGAEHDIERAIRDRHASIQTPSSSAMATCSARSAEPPLLTPSTSTPQPPDAPPSATVSTAIGEAGRR
jgi:hypothetical protein